jgi:hypothetical protein
MYPVSRCETALKAPDSIAWGDRREPQVRNGGKLEALKGRNKKAGPRSPAEFVTRFQRCCP